MAKLTYTYLNINTHPRYREAFEWASLFYGSGIDGDTFWDMSAEDQLKYLEDNTTEDLEGSGGAWLFAEIECLARCSLLKWEVK